MEISKPNFVDVGGKKGYNMRVLNGEVTAPGGRFLLYRRLRMHISIAAETLFMLGPLPVTNALLMSWIAMALLIVVGLLFTYRMRVVPSGMQNVGEAIMEAGIGFFSDVMGSRRDAEKVFPIVATLFIFILLSNWMGLIPGVGSIGFIEEATPSAHEEPISPGAPASSGAPQGAVVTDEHALPADTHTEEVVATTSHSEPVFVPLFRSAYADLNMTLALAIISVLATHVFGVMTIGFFKHAHKFFNFSSPINFFVGILELFGEVSKMVSFSFRLFGNIFAGEVLLVVILTLVPYIAPLPFFALEVFVGFIQALVFSMLTLVFMKVAMAEAEGH
ncbi:MAG: F0F1 ATP synthase subunit A [Candidatus Spechtbacterales bacterium]